MQQSKKQPSSITVEQVAVAIDAWKDFWEPPRAMTDSNLGKWLKIYHAAVNESDNLRWYWNEVCQKITTRCRFFPYPSDLIAAADDIKRATCAEHVQPDGTPTLVA